MTNAGNDRMMAEEVKMAASALNHAINKASNAGLAVQIETTSSRAVNDPVPIVRVQATVSRPL